MIRTAFDKFCAWFMAVVWPLITRWFKALYADPLMHVVTFVLGMLANPLVRMFW